MGADLILGGFTTDTRKADYDKEAVIKLIKARAAEMDDDTLLEYDAAGLFADADEFVNSLLDGLEIFSLIVKEYFRYSVPWSIPETSLVFYTVGNSTWGDDPFDGYTDLIVFLDATAAWPEVSAAVGYVCGGLPRVEEAATYAL